MPDDELQTLSGLPLELQLCIADAVGERCDRASLALASPLLGLAACRELPSYQGLEMSLAFHHVLGGTINEQLLRSYASRSEATPEGCEWLARVDAAAGVLVVSGPLGGYPWHLKSGSTVGALLRRKQLSGGTLHFEGKEGAELMVCCEEPDGSVWHCEGKGRIGTERLVRLVPAGGDGVLHFKGEMGAARLVRVELSSGDVCHFEGEKGAERLVRREMAYGGLQHYKGKRGAERPMRYELPYGGVILYYCTSTP